MPSIMDQFHYAHLPAEQQDIVRPFEELVNRIETFVPEGDDRDAALAKLVEAKDLVLLAFG